MTLNKHACAKEVRSVCISHKCSRSKNKNISGKLLSSYFHQNCFSVNESYQICSILDMCMNCLYSTDRSEAAIDARLPLEVESDTEAIDLTCHRRDKSAFFNEKLSDTIKSKTYHKQF